MKYPDDFVNKIIHGDCLEIMKNIPDNSVDLVLTDPPYNISQENNISRKSLSSKSHNRNMDIKLNFGKWDEFKDEKDYFDFTETWFKECVRILKPKGWMYIWFDKMKTGYFDLFLAKKYGMFAKTIFVWTKSNPVPQFRKVNYLSSSEFCWIGTKGKSKVKNFGQQKDMHNNIKYPNSSIYGETTHPTEKPIEIISNFIKHNSNKNDIVLDPFLGSGTTAVACKKLGRKYIGIEISGEYCRIAEKRINAVPEKLERWFE